MVCAVCRALLSFGCDHARLVVLPTNDGRLVQVVAVGRSPDEAWTDAAHKQIISKVLAVLCLLLLCRPSKKGSKPSVQTCSSIHACPVYKETTEQSLIG